MQRQRQHHGESLGEGVHTLTKLFDAGTLVNRGDGYRAPWEEDVPFPPCCVCITASLTLGKTHSNKHISRAAYTQKRVKTNKPTCTVYGIQREENTHYTKTPRNRVKIDTQWNMTCKKYESPLASPSRHI